MSINESVKEENKEQKAIKLVFSEKDSYERATKDKRTEIKTIWDAYNGQMTDTDYPWQSDKFIPKMRTEIAYIVPFVFSGDPEMEVEGIGEEDKFIATLYDKIINYRMSEGIEEAHDKVSDWVMQALTFGTSLLKVKWDFQTKENEDGTQTPVKDAPDFEVPNILDIYVNPLIPTVHKQVSVIERSTQTLQEIKNNPVYKNTDKLKPKGEFDKDNYNSQSLNATDLNETEMLQTDMEIVEIYERYSNDRIITVADGKERVLLRDVPNPYGKIPFIKLICEKDPLPNRFYGRGVGQNTIDLQALYYDLFNQIMDNIKVIANKMWLSEPGNIKNPRDAVSKPAGIIQVNDITKTTPVEHSDIKQSIFEILAKVDDEHKRASGANDVLQGAESEMTLGQDELRLNNSSNRYELIRKRVKRALGDAGELLLIMEVQNLQDINSPILRIFPKEAREAVFGILKNQTEGLLYDVRVRGDSILTLNKDVVVKRLIDLFNLSGEILTPNEKRKFIRAIIELGGLMSIIGGSVDELVAEEAPMMPGEGLMPEEGPMNPSMMSPINSDKTQPYV